MTHQSKQNKTNFYSFLSFFKLGFLNLKKMINKIQLNHNDLDLLFFISRHGDITALKSLLEKGVDVNFKNYEGNTPLHLSTLNNYTEITQLLLNFGANPHIKNTDGKSPLIYAVNHLDTLKVFFSSKIDINFQYDKGETLLHFSCLNNNLDTTQFLILNHANIDAQDNHGDTPLHCACFLGNISIISHLLINKADHTIMNKSGCTPYQRIPHYLKNSEEVYSIFQKFLHHEELQSSLLPTNNIDLNNKPKTKKI